MQSVSQFAELELHTIDGTTPTAKRNHKCTRTSKVSAQKGVENEVPTRVLRSSKRLHKVLGLSDQKPTHILSWLINYNTVLPKYKVFYRKLKEKATPPQLRGG
jgi:hypothetical protein